MDTDKSEAEVKTVLGLHKLNSQLDMDNKNGLTFIESLAKWQARVMWQMQCQRMLEARLPFWLYLRNPYWTMLFEIRRAMARRASNSHENLLELGNLFVRAEFIRPLPPSMAEHVREKIHSRKLTQWMAVSLLNSYACISTAEGAVIPASVGKAGLVAGKWVGAALALLFALVIVAIAAEIANNCARPCVIIGSAQAMTLVLGAFLAVRSLSWGKELKSKKLADVLVME